jgi:hypothetical protein
MTSIPYCGQPDYERLESFIKTHKLEINIEKIKTNFTREIVFAEDE